jgi:hypothetical protein
MKASVLASGVLVAATVAARAQRAMPDQGNGRYSLVPRGEEFLRLDSRTGEVSICAWRGAGWACVGLPDDRAVYEVEIGRLMQENERLKRQLSARERASRDAAKPEQSPVRTALPPVAEPATPPGSSKQEPPAESARAPATTAVPDARSESVSAASPAPSSVLSSVPPPTPSPAAESQPPSRQPETRMPETPSTIAPSGREGAQLESSAPPPQAPSGPQTGKGAAQRNDERALDRALAVFERAWRQLVDMVRRLP